MWKFFHLPSYELQADDLLIILTFHSNPYQNFPDILFSSSNEGFINYFCIFRFEPLSHHLDHLFHAFKYSYFPYCVEVESAYEQALEEEEERILCMRKKLLLSTRKIREREHEMMIQGRQSAMRKQLETRENELNEMLRRLEKQVSENLVN